MKFILEKVNQEDKKEDIFNNNNKNKKISKNNLKKYEFNSAEKEKDPEDEYNDFEENISIEFDNF